jgi:hypothetical protein
MKSLFAGIAASTVLIVGPALAAGDDSPAFENGPVWDVVQVQTRDGHFDDYMKWVSTAWKAGEEAQKKEGVIVDYKVYVVDHPRAGEPDVLLCQEFRNMAAFDTPVAEQFEIAARISRSIEGSIAKMNQQQAARGAIRTVLGSMMMREAVLK